jgi:hypothetical protein
MNKLEKIRQQAKLSLEDAESALKNSRLNKESRFWNGVETQAKFQKIDAEKILQILDEDEDVI